MAVKTTPTVWFSMTEARPLGEASLRSLPAAEQLDVTVRRHDHLVCPRAARHVPKPAGSRCGAVLLEEGLDHLTKFGAVARCVVVGVKRHDLAAKKSLE